MTLISEEAILFVSWFALMIDGSGKGIPVWGWTIRYEQEIFLCIILTIDLDEST